MATVKLTVEQLAQWTRSVERNICDGSDMLGSLSSTSSCISTIPVFGFKDKKSEGHSVSPESKSDDT